MTRRALGFPVAAGRRRTTGLVAAAMLLAVSVASLACRDDAERGTVVTFPGSAVGAEAEVLRVQLDRFMRENPQIQVVARRTPDAADQRRQLYVQWLNARARDPDVLQLDVIWTPEFAAAGWLRPLDGFDPDVRDFFPASVEANRWRGRLHALPWFVDVGMLYWRTDRLEGPPASYAELVDVAGRGVRAQGFRYGLVWQGARYEGLVTVFLEHATAFGGAILDETGRVVVDSEACVKALAAMRAAVEAQGIVPREALTWHEEESRFAFQNGHALLMRNWPYAHALMSREGASRIAGRFAVAPFPAASAEGRPAAALGGSQLAINANSDVPEAAWAVIEYLTRPGQMLERARIAGHYPPRRSLYAGEALSGALAVSPEEARRIIDRAVPRPATPVYSQLSALLQIHLHRALTGQEEPGAALAAAAEEIRSLLARVGLAPGGAL